MSPHTVLNILALTVVAFPFWFPLYAFICETWIDKDPS